MFRNKSIAQWKHCLRAGHPCRGTNGIAGSAQFVNSAVYSSYFPRYGTRDWTDRGPHRRWFTVVQKSSLCMRSERVNEWFGVLRHFWQFFSHTMTVFACHRYYGCYHTDCCTVTQTTGHRYPTQSHYPDTRPTSPSYILLMLSAKRGSI